MDKTVEGLIAVVTAIIGVGILALLISKQSNTSSVIQSFGAAFTNALGVAESPVTGSSFTPSASYPTS